MKKKAKIIENCIKQRANAYYSEKDSNWILNDLDPGIARDIWKTMTRYIISGISECTNTCPFCLYQLRQLSFNNIFVDICEECPYRKNHGIECSHPHSFIAFLVKNNIFTVLTNEIYRKIINEVEQEALLLKS